MDETNNCLIKALNISGLHIPSFIRIPVPTPIEEMPVLCAKLGLIWIGDGTCSLDEEPIIAVYLTRPGYSHASFLSSPLLLQKEVAGLIRFPIYNWVGIYDNDIIVLTKTLFEKFAHVIDADNITFVLVRAYPNEAADRYLSAIPISIRVD